MKKTTIGFVSIEDPFHNKKAWSGTIYKLQDAISAAGYNVKWIAININNIRYHIIKAFNKVRLGQRSKFKQSAAYWKLCAKSINMKEVGECDFLFFPSNAQIIRFASFKKPIINFSDSTFAGMLDYYWFNQKKGIRKEGNDCERYALLHSDIIIRASDWASASVLNDYGGDPHKNYVIEFGANLDEKDIKPNTPWQKGETLNILFSGVDWKRKGGNIAIEVVAGLNKIGLNAKLVIVGIHNLAPKYNSLPFVENVGFLDKNKAYDYQKYIDTIKKCHILLLPTQAECAGIVFCEASAFGLPSFTYSTGGIGNYVINGINGYRLNPTAGPDAFIEKIKDCAISGELSRMRDSCFSLYKEKLNWKVWGEKLREIIDA